MDKEVRKGRLVCESGQCWQIVGRRRWTRHAPSCGMTQTTQAGLRLCVIERGRTLELTSSGNYGGNMLSSDW